MAAHPERAPSSSSSLLKGGSGWVEDRLAEVERARAGGDAGALGGLLARHPEWNDERVIRLIYEDYCARRDRGDDVVSVEVLGNHPRFRDELGALLGFDRLVRRNAGAVAFPRVGDRLGNFSLVAELGRGASGRAYLATEDGLADRLVVLKLLPIDLDEHLRLARLQNTHIIPIFSERTFPDRGLRVLCMPYLGGLCLDRLLDDLTPIPPEGRNGRHFFEAIERLQPRRLTEFESGDPYRLDLEAETWTRLVCRVAACLADGLQAAHARGLIHMDLKPSNVLIAGDGLPVLLDFHLARHPVRQGESVTGRLGGTPGRMSPEQSDAVEATRHGRPAPRPVDGRCDIHALGLLLAEALDGRPVTGAEAGPLSRWTPRNPAVSPGLADIVRRCLAADPSARYPTAVALGDDLRRHLEDLPLKGVPNRSPRERWAKWRRRRPGVLARLALSSAGLGMILAVLATLGVDHLRRLDDADKALAIGQALMSKGRHAAAVSAFARGLDRVAGRPDGRRAEGLKAALTRARLGQQADDLHQLAEAVRFRFGIDPPDPPTVQALAREFPPAWDRRSRLMDWAARSGDPRARERVRTDLIELASIWADALVRGDSGNGADGRRRRALALLKEAESTCGQSSSLSRQIRSINRDGPESETGDETFPPRDAWERYDLGRSYLRSKRFAEARDEFERASSERPQDFWSCFYLGICEYQLGRFEEAVSDFRVCEALSPTTAECSYNRALALEAQGRRELAWSAYSRALATDPRLAAARLNRGRLSFEMGDHRSAIADYNEAIRRAGKSPIGLMAEESLKIAAGTINRGGEASPTPAPP